MSSENGRYAPVPDYRGNCGGPANISLVALGARYGSAATSMQYGEGRGTLSAVAQRIAPIH